MLHSYEGLDREGGFDRVRMLAPLRHRDFRRLWSGMCASLFGDGVFMVAMAWQVYALSSAPTAMAVVGIAMTVPTILFLLLLTGAVRFIHHALFEGTLLSLHYYLVDAAVVVGIGLLGYRYTRARQMTTQYRWLYERTGPLTWRERASG
jgi:hypothetical protein